MFKKCQVLLLPTNEKAILGLNSIHNHLFFANDMAEIPTQKYQHLYIISDEEIKEGNWIIYNNSIYKTKRDKESSFWILINTKDKYLPSLKNPTDCKKIIATTDDKISINLGLEKWESPLGKHGDQIYTRLCPFPQPSQSFIEKYVEEYNKGNVITEVMVEYILNETGNYREFDVSPELKEKLKINKDNTITIRKIKDSWNKEELISLFDKYLIDITNKDIKSHSKWIEENL